MNPVAPMQTPSYHLSQFRTLEAMALKADLSLPSHERIGYLHHTLYQLLEKWKPHVMVIEKAFHGKNSATTLKLGEARGALMTVAYRHKLPLIEIPATTIKRSITGQGLASKEQVSLAVQTLLRFSRGKLPYDVTDALAIALCYGLHYGKVDTQRPRRSRQPKKDFEQLIQQRLEGKS